MTSKHPGRPIDRSNKSAIRRLEIWLHVESIRARHHEMRGRIPSVASVAEWIAKSGGMGSAIGGNGEAILAAMDP